MKHSTSNRLLQKIAFSSLILAPFASQAAPMMSGAFSTGIVYSARHDAGWYNPAGLASGDSKASIWGMYNPSGSAVIDDAIYGTASANFGQAGVAVGSFYTPSSKTYMGGVGFGAGKLAFGVGISKSDSTSASYDAGITLDLGSVRLGFVDESLSSFSTIGVGLGFANGPMRFEVDFRNWAVKTAFAGTLSAGLSYHMKPITLLVSYTASYASSSISNGTVHAGLEWEVMQNLCLTGEWKPELYMGNWAAGLRLKF
jgi:hypothetical protein